MKTIYIKIDGMTCDNCKNKINNKLTTSFSNFSSVTFEGDIAEIKYNGKLNKEGIISEILNLGYETNIKMFSTDKKKLRKSMSFMQFILIVFVLISLSTILNKLFGFNIFNMIPVINSKMTYLALFLTGLFTSIHCVSMCGAINLLASKSTGVNYKRPILYNLGRLTSYTVIGGFVGLIGGAIKINASIQAIIVLFAASIMFLMALNMMGLLRFSLNYKMPKFLRKLDTKGSYVIGLLNGLMPCGPLQAMQVYALSTGSLIYGALSMFFFSLGTIPLMLFVGLISNFLKTKQKIIFNKISTVLILILSLVMLNRGLLGLGIDISNAFKENYDNYLKSEVVDGYQVIEFDLSYNGYKDIVIQKGIPVKMIINANANNLSGCNNAVLINEYNINKKLTIGENIIEFTPTKTGTFVYTCWMQMLKNSIVVVDNISEVD